MLLSGSLTNSSPRYSAEWQVRNTHQGDLGEIITFYSYKGGTGRTLALVNCVGLMADQWPSAAKPLLVWDFDLEAPGIHHYLSPYLSLDADFAQRPGTLELFENLCAEVATRIKQSPARAADGRLDDTACAELIDGVDLQPYLTATKLAGTRVIKAGRFDDSYAQRLSRMNWESLFAQAPGIFRALATRLQRDFAYIFVDARTGLSDTSGICTMLLPDVLVLVFTPNRQSLSGIEHLVREASKYRRSSSDLRSLRIYPLPSRVELSSEDYRQAWQRGALQHPVFGNVDGYQSLFDRLFAEMHGQEVDMTAYLDLVQVPHSPDYAYGERLCFTTEASRDRLSLRIAYESFLPWLVTGAQPWEAPAHCLLRLRVQQWLRDTIHPSSDDEGEWLLWFESLPQRITEVKQRLALPDDYEALIRVVPTPEAFDLGAASALADALRQRTEKAAESFKVLSELVAGAEPVWSFGQIFERWLTLLGRRVGNAEKSRWVQDDMVQSMNRFLHAIGAPRAARWRWQSELANMLRAVGVWGTAMEVLEQLHRDKVGVLSQAHRESIDCAMDLVDAMLAMGRNAEAVKLGTELKVVAAHHFGDEDQATLAALNCLSRALFAQGDLEGARVLERQVLELRRRILGPEHPVTLSSEDALAGTLEAQGDLAGARAIHERVLDLRRRILGWEHPDSLRSMNNLAGALFAQGELIGAKTLEEKVLELRRQVLGSEHPDTLTSMNNLALMLKAQGDTAGAKAMHEEELDICLRILGPMHPDTLTSMNNLAGSLYAQGDLAGARTLQERVLDLRRRVLGPEHPDTLTSMNNLACTLHSQGDLANARSLEEQVIEFRLRVLGPEHPDTLTSMSNFASTLDALGDLDGARHREEQVLNIRSRVLGLEHPDTLTSMNNLAGTLHAQGDLASAGEMYKEVLEIRRRILGVEHPDTLASLNNVADILREQGQASAASAIYHEMLETQTRILGAEHPSTLDVLAKLMDMATDNEGPDGVSALFQKYPAAAKALLGRRSLSGKRPA